METVKKATKKATKKVIKKAIKDWLFVLVMDFLWALDITETEGLETSILREYALKNRSIY